MLAPDPGVGGILQYNGFYAQSPGGPVSQLADGKPTFWVLIYPSAYAHAELGRFSTNGSQPMPSNAVSQLNLDAAPAVRLLR
jgi:hypothetical protein